MPFTTPPDNGSPVTGLDSAGMRSVRIEPSSIPNLVNALQNSLDAVGLQIEHAITELRIRPWAGDPVSNDAAEEFNRRAIGGGEDALTALCGYRDQLQTAAESLAEANEQYQQTEEDNISRFSGGC